MDDKPSILIVDDDESFKNSIIRILKFKGFQVQGASNYYEAVELIKSEIFDIIVSDIIMPEKNGIDLLIKVREIDKSLRVIMMTAFSKNELIAEALKNRAYEIIFKPFDIEEFISLLLEV